MTETRDLASSVVLADDALDSTPPSFDIPSNKYADIAGLWPPELFEGFEEFVLKCRRESGFGREPPPWW